ncbi:MAG: hypothetical protein M3321_02445 [Actinomycetota bacterium]|nr:hypothetical protein [Actinomycetota bacterium]
MTGVWISLVRLLTRALLALAIAVPIGLVLALVRDERGFAEDFGVACLLVGCFFLLLAPAGSSPAMRAGTIDAWTASFFPKLVPGMMNEYSGTSLAASAAFGITGLALLVVGAILVS